ncbi:MAG: Flp pilus assembly complex ATPase component TadA [Oscillospiraceae bacterium]|nr:Flp pilus assembly complex ATPase component TadA [Oscillospiraceae bacterium]
MHEIEQLHFRAGQPPSVLLHGAETVIPRTASVTADDLRRILSASCGGSLYSVDRALCEGYLTLPGGHRIGICGCAVMEGDRIKTIDPSSLTIRVAREHRGIGMILQDSTLIAGPPGCGKTTLLRDCVRLISDRAHERIALIDERGEIAAVKDGAAQLYVGSMTDVMSNCPKAAAIPMAIRTMSPQWIAVDEITREADADEICRSAYCGIRILATCHITQRSDLDRRPIYRRLMSENVFHELLLLRQDHSLSRESLEVRS